MTDTYGRRITYLRLSVTERCSLRCRYCMPEAGACSPTSGEPLTEDELLRAVEAAASLGITKLRITGGEPLLRADILDLCRRAAAVPGIREVCLTTNGLLLPTLAKPLWAAGVRRVNISLDTLDPARYAYMTRQGDLQDALAGIEAALAAGFDRVKLNTVLIGGFNDGELPALAALTRRWPVDVRFIELMPMPGAVDFGPESYLPCDAVLERLPELRPTGRLDGVARMYALPGACGEIGLISPISCQFCGTCDRIRLTADGRLKPCLHAPEEYSIRGLDLAGTRAQLQRAIWAKPRQHGALSAACRSQAGRSMDRIGG